MLYYVWQHKNPTASLSNLDAVTLKSNRSRCSNMAFLPQTPNQLLMPGWFHHFSSDTGQLPKRLEAYDILRKWFTSRQTLLVI